ncbi:MAG: SLATT domain-containing protein [Pseudomonadota bacterium]|nr:SLATT domain-containing protein [Pseudomonadota bacterium]
MNRKNLLKDIAETGYNVGFGAKKHFASYDIATKLPSLIALMTMAVGIFGLIYPTLSLPAVSATVLLLGLIAKDVNSYQKVSEKYEQAGVQLTTIRDELRAIYRTVDCLADGEDLSKLIERYTKLRNDAKAIGFSKHLLFSDWYAHYKFFWQDQVEWIDEQLKFRFWRDKVPLSLMAFLALIVVGTLGLAVYLSAIDILFARVCTP